jgi:hypothetical protein
LVSRAEVAGVDIGELAPTADTTSAPATRIEQRTLSVGVARRGATGTLATLMTGQTGDDLGDTETADAGIGHTGVVVLVAAIAMVFARSHANAAATNVPLGTLLGTPLLGAGVLAKTGQSERRYRRGRTQDTSAIVGARQPAGQEVETMKSHQHLSVVNRAASSRRRMTMLTVLNIALDLGNACSLEVVSSPRSSR